MRKILLIDNETTLLKKLQTLIPGEEIVRCWDNLDTEDPNTYDLIVLSGGSSFPIIGNEEKLSKEIELIKTTTTPIIGICFGHELIVHAFGGSLQKLSEKHKGVTTIDVQERHEIFGDLESFTVYENHTYAIDTCGPDLIPLASSDHSIAVVAHKTKPIFGFQFHPEHHTDTTLGDEIFMRAFAFVEDN